MKPFISVIIPTRNRADYVGEAIESVLSQNISDLEIWVIDDASYDNTPQILAKFAHHINILRLNESKGVAHARNQGIRQSTGYWLAFLDSDDQWLSGKLEVQMEVIASNSNIGLCFTDYAVNEQDQDGSWRQVAIYSRREGERNFANLFRGNFIGTLTALLRRDCWEIVGGFDETLIRGSDYDLWLKVAQRWQLCRIPQVLANYRRHDNSLTGLSPTRDLETYVEITRRWIQRDPKLLESIGWSYQGWQDWIDHQRQTLIQRN
jgi:glycosyltransferase involved in cell wall biosynthesis